MGADDEQHRWKEEQDRLWREHREEHLKIMADLQTLHDSNITTKASLENGQKAFVRHEEQIKALQPRPKTWGQLFAAGVGVFVVGGGILWGGFELLAARPTDDKVKEAIATHAATPSHPDTAATLKGLQLDVQQVRYDQAGMKATQDATHADVASIKADMKTLVRQTR